jgi:hypothetical protein
LAFIKITKYTLAVMVWIAGAMITGCQWWAEKAENVPVKSRNAGIEMAEDPPEPDKATKDTIQLFRKYEERMVVYDKNIAEFKAQIAKATDENKARYEKKLAELEQKYSDMKKIREKQ